MAIFFASAVWSPVRWRRAIVARRMRRIFCLRRGRGRYRPVAGMRQRRFRLGHGDGLSRWNGISGTDEYAPPGADNSLVATGLPGACLVSDPAAPLGQGDPDMTPDWSLTNTPVWPLSRSPIFPEKPPVEHLRILAEIPQDGF